jgi:hypothetical protein
MIAEGRERRRGAPVTSPAKIRANQRNARKSTGPRTRAGKATVARNALRHGLTLPVLSDPTLAREVVDLARAIERSEIGAEADETGHDLACRIAEAMIDFRRVRLAKLPLAATLDADPCDRKALMQLSRLDRYEGRAFARRNRAIRAFGEAVVRRAKIGRTKPTEERQRFRATAPARSVPAPAVPTCEAQVAAPAAGLERANDACASESTKQSQRRKANNFSEPVVGRMQQGAPRVRGYRFATRLAYPGCSNYRMRVMRPRLYPMPERTFRPAGAGVGYGKRVAKRK